MDRGHQAVPRATPAHCMVATEAWFPMEGKMPMVDVTSMEDVIVLVIISETGVGGRVGGHSPNCLTRALVGREKLT